MAAVFNVQDDDGLVSAANAYIDVDFFKDYHDSRGNDYSSYSDAQIKVAIVKATDHLDQRFRYRGVKKNDRQVTQFPRIHLYDRDGDFVEGVPQEVKEADAEYAFRALSSSLQPDPDLDSSGRPVRSKREKVGPIETETEWLGTSAQLANYPAADLKLKRAGYVVEGNRLRRGS